jgi:hypothetical protein
MRSMRSTTSSGVGTQITSLPAWPTCGSYGFCCAAAGKESASAAMDARTSRIMMKTPVLDGKVRKKGGKE